MGTCFVNSNQKKSKLIARPTINQQVNIAVAPTTPRSLHSINTFNNETHSQKILNQKQLNIDQRNKQPQLLQLNPIEDMKRNNNDRKSDIRPTTSMYIPDQECMLSNQRGSGYESIIISSDGSANNYMNRGSDLPQVLPSRTIARKVPKEGQFNKISSAFVSNLSERDRNLDKQNKQQVQYVRISKPEPQITSSRENDHQRMVKTQMAPDKGCNLPNGGLWNTKVFKHDPLS